MISTTCHLGYLTSSVGGAGTLEALKVYTAQMVDRSGTPLERLFASQAMLGAVMDS